MPYKKGSCLNEEYTELIKEIYKLVKDAAEKFESLPPCIKNLDTGRECDDVKWDLPNTRDAIWCLAHEFGISLEDKI